MKSKISISPQFVLRLALWAVILWFLSSYYLPEISNYLSGLFNFPFDWDPYEGFTVSNARLMREGISPYGDIFSFPFVSYPYPPLYPAIVAIIGGSPARELFAARFISISSFVIILFVLVCICRRLGLGIEGGISGAILLLTNIDCAIWFPLARVDMLCICFTLTAVLMAEKAGSEGERGPFYWILALVMLFLGLLTKHLVLPLFVIALIYGLAKKDYRKHTTRFVLALLPFTAMFLLAFKSHIFESLTVSSITAVSLDRVFTFFTAGLKQYPVIYSGFIGLAFLITKRGIFTPFTLFAAFCLFQFLMAGHGVSLLAYLVPKYCLSMRWQDQEGISSHGFSVSKMPDH